MLLQLLPEILEEITSYCSRTDIENLSCCCSAYNEVFRPTLWSAVCIPSKDLLEIDFTTDGRLEHLQHTKKIRIEAVSPQEIQKKSSTDTKVNRVYHNCRLVFKTCTPTFLATWYLPEVVLKTYKTFRNLMELHISKSAANDQSLETIYNMLPQLKSLSIKICGRDVSDNGFTNLKKLECLQKLHIFGRGSMTDNSLQLISSMIKLRSLSLHWCTFTDAGLGHLKSLTGLEELEISHCVTISNPGLLHLSALVTLQKLNLTGCYKIYDSGIMCLKDLVNLRTLNLTDLCSITHHGLEQCVSTLPKLHTLNLSRCGISSGLDQLDLSRIANLIV